MRIISEVKACLVRVRVMSVMEYNNYGAAYTGAYQAAYPSYTGYSSQPNHFNLKVGTILPLSPALAQPTFLRSDIEF